VKRDEKQREEYQKGFSVAELFPVISVGIATSRDSFVIDPSRNNLVERIRSFLESSSPQEALLKFSLKENLKWKAANALKHHFNEANIVPISYRPFDSCFVYYHDDFIERPRGEVMKHYLKGDNLGLLITKGVRDQDYRHVFVTKSISEVIFLSGTTASNAMNVPLFLYAEDGSRVANLRKEMLSKIEDIVGKITPEDIFDYIYAVLHSPGYREKYKELLKTDFPRIPYPKDKKQFAALVALGKELRELHLLKSPKINPNEIAYPKEGSNIVEKIAYKGDKVYINAKQYFGNVPEIAWNFYIGGYQPAQKWLKDRKGRTLTNEDIEHYQKIVVALTETDRVVKEIDPLMTP